MNLRKSERRALEALWRADRQEFEWPWWGHRPYWKGHCGLLRRLVRRGFVHYRPTPVESRRSLGEWGITKAGESALADSPA